MWAFSDPPFFFFSAPFSVCHISTLLSLHLGGAHALSCEATPPPPTLTPSLPPSRMQQSTAYIRYLLCTLARKQPVCIVTHWHYRATPPSGRGNPPSAPNKPLQACFGTKMCQMSVLVMTFLKRMWRLCPLWTLRLRQDWLLLPGQDWWVGRWKGTWRQCRVRRVRERLKEAWQGI